MGKTRPSRFFVLPEIFTDDVVEGESRHMVSRETHSDAGYEAPAPG